MKNMDGEKFGFIIDYLNRQTLMSLATTNGVNLCNSNVYFTSDKWLNFYFMSDMCTECADNAINHPQVALSITDENNHLLDRSEIQARGICEMISEYKWHKILKLWNDKYKDKVLSLEDLEKRHLCLFKIVLTRLKYYDINLAEKVIEFNF